MNCRAFKHGYVLNGAIDATDIALSSACNLFFMFHSVLNNSSDLVKITTFCCHTQI